MTLWLLSVWSFPCGYTETEKSFSWNVCLRLHRNVPHLDTSGANDFPLRPFWYLPGPVMEIYSTWHFHISVHMTYSFDHKRHDVTTLSWYNHTIINISCGRMLVTAGYKGRLDLCLSEDTFLCLAMMTSSNGNNFRVTGPLCGELTGHRWITLTKASYT